MNTIKTKGYNIVRVKDCCSCGDVLMDTEVINDVTYNIYLGYNGYHTYYAVKA